jgi:hypothetical protein
MEIPPMMPSRACPSARAAWPGSRPAGIITWAKAKNEWVSRYEAKPVPAVDFQNSGRIFDLICAGHLYLSLQDAIALAPENNLDIELERYLPRIAQTDIQRAKGGGLLRGLSLLVNEPPPGIGGPSGPLLTTLTASSTPAAPVNTNFADVALITCLRPCSRISPRNMA